MSLAGSAAAYYALVSSLSARSRKRALAIWAELDRQSVAASWDRLAKDALLVEVSTAQQMAAIAASRFMGNALDAQAAEWAGELVNPLALAGIASDGRDLDSLLFQPVLSTLSRLKDHVEVDEAMSMGAAELDAIVGTQVTDASRAAMQVEMAAQPSVTGYVRMLTPPSCGRCAILAGRFYRFSDGFLRHPQCFPAGTVVSGPAARAATRRWYQGELVVIETASGEQLTVTGNHPILTGRGWVAANTLHEGSHVVRSSLSQGAHSLEVPHEQQVPTLIEDVGRSFSMGTLRRVPTSSEDFHGDGGHGEVDVVSADRHLRRGHQPAFCEHRRKAALVLAVERTGVLFGQRSRAKSFSRVGNAADSRMSRGNLTLPFLLAHLAGTDGPGFAATAYGRTSGLQVSPHDVTADVQLASDRVLALAGRIGGVDSRHIERLHAPRWDAPSHSLAMERGVADAGVGQDLLQRLAGQVTLERVVEKRSIEWSGHVYNLTSSEGWFSANGLIVSNCDCVHIPSAEDAADDLRTDPTAYFDSLSTAEQNKYFGKGSAEAIRQGADMNQVVNARRKAAGMSRVGQIETTTEGTTRRGVAGRLLIRAEGGDPSQRGATAKSPRLTPDAILQVSKGDKARARDLMQRYGYIL